MSKNRENRSQASRRDFLKTGAVAGGALAANLAMLSNVHADGMDEIKIGLIGCGGRGKGAADNALHAAPHVKLHAMGDAFKDRLEDAHKNLTGTAESDPRITSQAIASMCRRALLRRSDAFEKVINSGANYIILATPPGFRPIHLAAAVAAGKNIFTEKPVATDAAGIRKVLETNEIAKSKVSHRYRPARTKPAISKRSAHSRRATATWLPSCYWNQGHLGSI